MQQGQLSICAFIVLVVILLAYKFSLEQNDNLLLQTSKQEALFKNTMVRTFIESFTDCSDLGVNCAMLEVCNRSIWSGMGDQPRKKWSKDITTKIMNATTANIIDFKRLPLIKGLKNPCFGVQRGNIVEDVTAIYAIFNNIEVYCLPYFFLIGFPKSSSSYLYGILTQHKKIHGPYCFEDYPCPVVNQENQSVEIKEPNWWENAKTQKSKSFDKYTRLFSTAKDGIINSFLKTYATANCAFEICDMNEQVITGDFAPYTAWAPETWQNEEINQGSPEPVVLSPHKIYTILPNSKLIVLMKNPIDRLYSEYNSRVQSNKNRSVTDFHTQCRKAIKWWLACTKVLGLSERHCAFGSYYPRVLKSLKNFDDDSLNSESVDSDEFTDEMELIENYHIPIRIRIGLYVIYIKEWLSMFPRSSFLFLKYKTFMSDPLATLQDQVYPFLDLPFVRQATSPKEVNISQHSPMLPETREMLGEFYKPYNMQLSSLLEDDAFLWEE